MAIVVTTPAYGIALNESIIEAVSKAYPNVTVIKVELGNEISAKLDDVDITYVNGLWMDIDAAICKHL